MSAALVASILRTSTQHGVAPSELIGQLGPEAHSLNEQGGRISVAAAHRLWVEINARLPAVPLGLLQPLDDVFGPVAYLGRCAGSGREALDDLVRFASVLSSHAKVEIERSHNGNVLLRYEHLPFIERLGHPVDLGLAAIVRVVVGRRRDGMAEVRLKHAPFGRTEPYRAAFGANVGFEKQSTEVVFLAEALDRPRPQPDPQLAGYLRDYLSSVRLSSVQPSSVQPSSVPPSSVPPSSLREGVTAAPHGDFATRLWPIVESLADEGVFEVRLVAQRLGFSERHLQRLARVQGIELRRVVAEVRCARATNYLRDRSIRVADVAEALGYADERAFNRAFKRWTGMTPSRWREHYQEVGRSRRG